MRRHLPVHAIAAIILATSAARAEERLVTVRSPHSVAVTIERMTEALKRREIPIVAQVDHASAAERIGEKLEPTQLLIFGNPKLGTPLMQANPRIGLDLPMRVLAWRDHSGQTWLAYVKPEVLKSDYGVVNRDA